MYKKVGNKEKVVVACGDDNNTVSFLFLLVSLFACLLALIPNLPVRV